MNNLNEFDAGVQAELNAIGGELLAGSDFESEISETGFSNFDDSTESVGR